ncbi:facilitated trehalose transporter Tret1-like [Hyalella azteca]|uniref:Facilitated trehalose transporter Tret1-like n=1 Tax=Hyalella azteca TaxID=294128 RepID=A0A979FI95_HYAAZ|nr:facilitated trehalose transporter Tret1-like [Hyalella azteca]
MENSGSELSENVSGVLCIALEILAGIAAVVLVERAGRKSLLVVSSASMAASLYGLGAFFYMLSVDEEWTRRYLFWLPMMALMIFLVAYGAGLGPVTWILIVDNNNDQIRRDVAPSGEERGFWTGSGGCVDGILPVRILLRISTVSVSAIAVGAVSGFNAPASFQLRAAQEFAKFTDNQTTSSLQNTTSRTADSSGTSGSGIHGHISTYHYFTMCNATDSNETTITPDVNIITQKLAWSLMVDSQPTSARSTIVMDNQQALARAVVVMDSEELSWFLSAYAVGALVGALGGGALMDAAGRRGALLASAVPSLVGWLMTGLGTNVSMLALGRGITGSFIGLSSAAGCAYIGEIASKDIRGRLGSFYELAWAIGVLLGMLAGEFTTWQHLALICSSPTLLYAVLVYCCKESPAYLLLKGRETEARAALQHFRGADYCIDQEIRAVKESQMEAKKSKLKLADLKKAHIYKPIIITFTIGVFSTVCGLGVLTANLSTIFKNSGSELSENVSGVLCIVLEILAGIAAVVLVERVGRKSLLVVTSASMAASHCGLGAFFYMLSVDEEWTRHYLFWIPMTALMMFLIAYGAGLGPVIWVLIGK